MGMSNAERQVRFRERALRDPDGSLRVRPHLYVSAQTAGALARILN